MCKIRTKGLIFLGCVGALGCGSDQKPIRPVEGAVTESVYASGTVKSAGQYQAFASVSGIIDSVYVKEGQQVRKGQTLLTIVDEQQRLTSERALLSAAYASASANKARVQDAARSVALAAEKLGNDSLLLVRQERLWRQQVGTLVELEQRRLQYAASVAALKSSQTQLAELRRQVALDERQSQLSWAISRAQQNQFRVLSEVDGIVFDLLREKGESAGPQIALANLGSADRYTLELQVDEYDISRVHPGAQVFVSMDSRKGEALEARVTHIHPIMNGQTRTFTVEAEFSEVPKGLYPNLTLEANIICGYKKRTLLIPRSYLADDSTVRGKKGENIRVKAGLRDLEKVEILSGLRPTDEIILPE